MANNGPIPIYKSLDDIRQRKQELRSLLQKDNGEITQLWQGLFAPSRPSTPTNKIQGFMTKGMGVVDGAILGWKLYQRFRPNKKAKSKNWLARLFG